MKNQLMKLRKAEGYIGIETMIIAALVITAGFIALTAIMTDVSGTASALKYNIGEQGFEEFKLDSGY
jgi:archaellin